jgi:hypothetical protein
MARISDPIPVEDATSLVIPGTYNPRFQLWENGGPWEWADPILSGASDSAKWETFPSWDPQHGHQENRISRDVITQLYVCGYALVKVLPDEAAASEPSEVDRFVDEWRHTDGWQASKAEVEMLLAELRRLQALATAEVIEP